MNAYSIFCLGMASLCIAASSCVSGRRDTHETLFITAHVWLAALVIIGAMKGGAA